MFFTLFLCKFCANCPLTQILSGTKLLQIFEIAKFLTKIPPFCQIYIAKIRKTCCKTYFYNIKFGGYKKKQYLCTVFFMVLDLRLSKDWVVGMTILLFFIFSIRLFANKNIPALFGAGMSLLLNYSLYSTSISGLSSWSSLTNLV